MNFRNKIYKLLRKSEKYTETDMVYLAKGWSWLMFNQVVSVIVGIVSLIIFTQVLPKDTFGVYRYILSFAAMFSVLTLPGINGSIEQAVARGYDGSVMKGLRTRLLWGLLAIVAGGVAGIYYYTQGNTVLAASFVIMGFFTPITNAVFVYQAVLTGRKMFNLRAITSIIVRVVSLLVMVTTIWLTKNVIIIILVYAGHLFLLHLAMWIYVHGKVKLNNQEDPKTLSYGKHLSAMDILKMIASQIDKILIFHFIGAADLAIYTVAMSPVSHIRALFTHIKSLAIPKLSVISEKAIKESLSKKIKKVEIMIIPVMLAYILLAPYIFQWFFPDYMEAVVYTRVLAVILIFWPRSLTTAALLAKMKTKSLYVIRIVAPIISIVLMAVLVRIYGLWGLITGMLIAEAVLYILYFVVFNKSFAKPEN